MKVREYKGKWVFEKDGVYFSLTIEEVRGMQRLCSEIIKQIECKLCKTVAFNELYGPRCDCRLEGYERPHHHEVDLIGTVVECGQ